MDMKTDINAPVSKPSAPVPSEPAAQAREKAPAGNEEKRKEIAREVAAMQEVLRQALNVEPVPERELQISFEKELNVVVVKVLDKDSGELIRQIPMPEQISIAKELRAAMRKMADSTRA